MSEGLQYDREQARREAATYEVPTMVDRRRSIREALDLPAGETVVSIGCGPGDEPAGLADVVGGTGTVHGVDRSPAMLSLARRHCAGRRNVHLLRGDATGLPIEDGRADAAVAVQVYEYVDDVGTALDELARVLRPGGRAVVYDTDFDSIVWRSSDPVRMDRVLEAWNDHCARPHLGSRLPPLLREAGLPVERVEPDAIVETELDEDAFVAHFRRFVGAYVADHEAIGPTTARAWADDLAERDERGETFFSLAQYRYDVRKPA